MRIHSELAFLWMGTEVKRIHHDILPKRNQSGLPSFEEIDSSAARSDIRVGRSTGFASHADIIPPLRTLNDNSSMQTRLGFRQWDLSVACSSYFLSFELRTSLWGCQGGGHGGGDLEIGDCQVVWHRVPELRRQ